MGPEQAAKACEWLGVKQAILMHYGRSVLTGTVEAFRKSLESTGIEVLELEPGKTTQ